MRHRSLSSALLVVLALAAPGFAQAGDPSFPKDLPRPQPDETPIDKRKTPPPGELRPREDPRQMAGLIDLRPKFRRGDEARYVMSIKSDNDVSISGLSPALPGDEPAKGGGGNSQKTDQEIGFVIKVIEASAEQGATVELIQESLKISIKHGGGEIFYDSTKPSRPNDDSDLIEPFVKGIVGSKLTIKFDADGNVKDVQGGGEMAMPGLMMKLGLPTDPKSIGSLFGPIGSTSAGKGLYRVGEKWTNADQVDTGPIGSFRMRTEHTLATARAGTAEVVFTGKIDPASESGKPGSPFQIKDSRYQGKYVWDTMLGALRSMECEQDITLEAGPVSKGGAKVKSTVRVERQAPKFK